MNTEGMTTKEKSDLVHKACWRCKMNFGNEFDMRDDIEAVVMISPYDSTLSIQTYDEFLADREEDDFDHDL